MANKKSTPTNEKSDQIRTRCSIEDFERHGNGDPIKGKKELSKKFRALRDSNN